MVVNPRGHRQGRRAAPHQPDAVAQAWQRALAYYASPAADEAHTDGKVALETIALLDKNKDRPFFIGGGFYRPHCPFIAQKVARHAPLDRIARPRGRQTRARRRRRGLPFPRIGASARWASARLFQASLRVHQLSSMRTSAGCSTPSIDCILTDNTIVIFASDHGYHLGEQGQWMKQTLFERSSARAPVIMAGPGVAAKGSRRIVEFLDIPIPRLRRWLSVPAPGDPPGTLAGAAPEESKRQVRIIRPSRKSNEGPGRHRHT